jgi:hypothetical protein
MIPQDRRPPGRRWFGCDCSVPGSAVHDPVVRYWKFSTSITGTLGRLLACSALPVQLSPYSYRLGISDQRWRVAFQSNGTRILYSPPLSVPLKSTGRGTCATPIGSADTGQASVNRAKAVVFSFMLYPLSAFQLLRPPKA